MPAAVLHDVLSAAARRLRDAGLDAADAAADVDVLARHVLGWDRARLLARRRDAVPGRVRRALHRAGRSPRRSRPGGVSHRHARVLRPRLRGHRRRADPAPGDGARRRGGARGPARRPGRADAPSTSAPAAAASRSRSRSRGPTPPSSASIDRGPRSPSPGATRAGTASAIASRWSPAICSTALSPRRPVDVVVSNPPYVPDDSADVAPDVARHEPASALYAGPDGLDVVRRLVAEAARMLRPGGRLVVEIGIGQADAVAAAAAAHATGRA